MLLSKIYRSRELLLRNGPALKYLTNDITVRTHKNFGHRNRPDSLLTKLWLGLLTSVFLGIVIDFEELGYMIGWKKEDEDFQRSEINPFRINPKNTKI